MRALALITDAFGSDGGIACYNRDLLSALAASDMSSSTLVLARFGGPTADDLPDNLIYLRPTPSRTAYAAKAISAAARMNSVDIVFCGHLYVVPLAAIVARLSGARLWLQLHGVEAWNRPGMLIRKAVEHVYLTTAVSRYTRQRFLEWADVDPATVRVLPNTVDAQFAPGPKPKRLVEQYALRDRKILLTVSRLSAREAYKGHDRVIRALPEVLVRHPEATYIIVGEGDDRVRLEALARASGVSTAVRFVGQVARQELPDYYRLADLFVMPSKGEGFGIVFLEASASGLPVIGGNCDGSVDALAEGRLGALVNPDDVNALVEAIAVGLDQKRKQLTDSAATRRFALDNFTRHVDDLVRSLC